MKLTPTAAALFATGLATNLPIRPVPAPASLPARTTSRNPEQQREAYYAAEAKRLRKQSKRLADAGMKQGDLL